MRQARFKTLLLASSLLALSACNGGPKVRVCISDPKAGGFQCVDENKKPFFVPYTESDKMIAFYPQDFQSVVDYWESQCQNPSP